MSRRLDYPLATKLLARAMGLQEAELERCFGPATAADLEALLSLRGTHSKTGHRSDDRAYVSWRYDLSGGVPGRSIWVFRHRGELIGTLGVERDVFSHRGTDIEVHKLQDILSREDHMGSGLGVWMNLRLQALFENTLCIGSTDYSHSIVTKLNTALPDWQTWRHPISLRARHKALIAADALLKAKRAIGRLFVKAGARLVEAAEQSQPSAPLRDSMSTHLIMPSRGVEKSAWRFAAHPTLRYRRFVMMYGEEPVAAATVSSDGPRAEVADALVRAPADSDGAVKILADLMKLVIDELARAGVEVVTTRVNDPLVTAALRRAGFIRRFEPCAMGYHFSNETLAGWMTNGVPLFLMPADSDFA